MRLAVSGSGYASATNEFLDANWLAASAAHTLSSALEHTHAMAGHTADGFARTYDASARQGVSALTEVVAAVANLGRMTDTTRRNHARAEARAVIGRARVDGEPPEPSYTHISLPVPPTAAGTHGSSLPHWAAWLLDQVEGFVWPDSDVGRLRAAAHAWRTASHQLTQVATHCTKAAGALALEVAPDVELAARAARRLASLIEGVAADFHALAVSCDDLADQVERHRDQVLDLVHDTIRDAVIVEGIGIVLGAVTGGITAAAATSVNGARIAAIAPRLIRILDGLRLAIGASETSARVGSSIVEARTGLRAFVNARVIGFGGERGCAGIPLLRGASRAGSVATSARAVPEAADEKLGNYVKNLFKGVSNPDRVGDGTTMAAIRNEQATGLMTQGKMHTMKGMQTLRGLERWLRTRPDAEPSDIALAKQLVAELKDALE